MQSDVRGVTPAPLTGDGKKKGKKRRRKRLDSVLAQTAGKSDKKKGHTKRKWSRKRLGAELARLDGNLIQLRDRLFDLHSVQLDHAEANASLGRRVEGLAELAAADGGQRQLLARRLDELAATVEVLGSRVSAPARDTRLAELFDRIERAESALSALDDRTISGPRAEPLLGEIEGRIAALRGALDAQADRLDQTEQGLAVALRPAAESVPPAWSVAIDTARAELDGRIAGLAEGLEATREQLQARYESEHRWTERRVRRLVGGGLAAAIVLLGLVTAGLLGVDWWRAQREPDPTVAGLQVLDGRPATRVDPVLSPAQSGPSSVPDQAEIAALSARFERLESAPPSPQAGPPLEDLLARLSRLEKGQLDAGRDLAASRAAADASSLRLTDLVGAQQAVLQRLDALQLKGAAADKELAVLDARVSAIAAPAGASAAPDASREPAVLEAQRYAIQLVVYTGRARIRPFASRYGIADQVSAIQVRLSGRPAYAVVLGRYASETEAREAIAGLTQELRALRPWVRQLPAGTRLLPVD